MSACPKWIPCSMKWGGSLCRLGGKCPRGQVGNALEDGNWHRVVQVATALDQKQIPAPKKLYVGRLQRCTANRDLVVGTHVHSLLVRDGYVANSYFCDYLIRFYGECGDFKKANFLFYEVPKPTLYTWNAIVSLHVKLGKWERVMNFYESMQQQGTKPAKVTYLLLLKACALSEALWHGRCIHIHILEDDVHTDVAVGSTLIDMYCKCGRVDDARFVFDTLPHRNAVTWGAMISGYVQAGDTLLALEVYESMQEQKIDPDMHTFSCVVKACGTAGAIIEGNIMYDNIIRCGLEGDTVITNTVIDMYAKCGVLGEARKVFITSPKSNVVAWGALISGYVQKGESIPAIELFHDLQHKRSVKANKEIFSSILKACGMMKAIHEGMLIHGQLVEEGLQSDAVIANTLMDMYAKCSMLSESHKIFCGVPCKNVVSWGTLISGCLQQGNNILSLSLYEEMQEQGVVPDDVVIICVLKACLNAVSGRQIHDQILRILYSLPNDVEKALVSMYLNCSLLKEARKVFDSVINKDVVLWSIMLDGYTRHGESCSALLLFSDMQEASAKPDKFIYSCGLKTCRLIGAIVYGMWIHDQIIKNGLEADVVIGSALIDMYTCCESLDEACRVFRMLPCRNEISWGAIIAGYAQSGNYHRIGELLERMHRQGLVPNDVIMTSVLAACSHAGLIKEGFGYFDYARKCRGCISSNPVYSCMVDLLGRSGGFVEAGDLMETMPMQPDDFSWAALLTGCRTYRNSDCASDFFDEFVAA